MKCDTSLAYFTFLRKKVVLWDHHAVSPPSQLSNQLANFHRIWCEHYGIRCHPDLILLNVLQYVIMCWTYKLVTWGQQ